MMKFNRHIRIYIWIALLAYMSIAALIAVNYFVLYQTGELDGLDKIVKAQQQTSGLYNGLSEGMAAYKYEGYRQRRPEIVAIGTSRAMQIRDYFFTKPFYNLGGLVQGQTQAFALLDQLILKHPPKRSFLQSIFRHSAHTKKDSYLLSGLLALSMMAKGTQAIRYC